MEGDSDEQVGIGDLLDGLYVVAGDELVVGVAVGKEEAKKSARAGDNSKEGDETYKNSIPASLKARWVSKSLLILERHS